MCTTIQRFTVLADLVHDLLLVLDRVLVLQCHEARILVVNITGAVAVTDDLVERLLQVPLHLEPVVPQAVHALLQ